MPIISVEIMKTKVELQKNNKRKTKKRKGARETETIVKL